MVLKGQYGWDAPRVIRFLFLVAIGAIAAGGFLFEVFNNLSSGFAWFLLWGMMATSFICFLGAYLMIRSSKKGKFKVLGHFVNELKIQGNEQVLDVGCGRGALTAMVAKRLSEGKVLGIDIWRQEDQSDNKAFNTMQNIHVEGIDGKVDLETADAQELPMEDESFDLVVSSLTLHSIPNRKKAIKEMVRVLRPRGKIGIVDMSHMGDCRRYLEHLGFTCTQHGPSWQMFPPAKTLIGRKP